MTAVPGRWCRPITSSSCRYGSSRSTGNQPLQGALQTPSSWLPPSVVCSRSCTLACVMVEESSACSLAALAAEAPWQFASCFPHTSCGAQGAECVPIAQYHADLLDSYLGSPPQRAGRAGRWLLHAERGPPPGGRPASEGPQVPAHQPTLAGAQAALVRRRQRRCGLQEVSGSSTHLPCASCVPGRWCACNPASCIVAVWMYVGKWKGG